MASTKLITVQELKDGTPIDANVQSKQIEVAILYAQDFFLQEQLGTALYLKLQTEVASPTSPYDTLLDTYVKPYLLNRVIADVLPLLQYQIRNKGLMELSSNDGQHSAFKETQWIIQEAQNKAEFPLCAAKAPATSSSLAPHL